MKKYDWDNYLIIENEFIEARKYLSFERTANLEADSPFLHNEIVLLGTKVETAMKKLISFHNPYESFCPNNISDYKRIILVLFPEIESYETVLTHSDYSFTPFKDWSKSKLSWWEVYSKIKHGSSRIPKLEHALNLLSAYQILLFLIQYEEQSNNVYISYTLDEIPRLLNLQFHRDTRIFECLGYGYPKEQIKVCEDEENIKNVIDSIREEREARER